MVLSDFGGVLTTPLDQAFATLNEDVGIEREYFVSQTPELTAMADAVIDLDAMKAQAAKDVLVAG
mgnify:CR=1 FL=1